MKKNKKNISINLSDRSVQENIRQEFEKSVEVLSPLLKRIDATDRLIDQIVYKLYGLADEEIEVVESSVTGARK